MFLLVLVYLGSPGQNPESGKAFGIVVVVVVVAIAVAVVVMMLNIKMLQGHLILISEWC